MNDECNKLYLKGLKELSEFQKKYVDLGININYRQTSNLANELQDLRDKMQETQDDLFKLCPNQKIENKA